MFYGIDYHLSNHRHRFLLIKSIKVIASLKKNSEDLALRMKTEDLPKNKKRAGTQLKRLLVLAYHHE